MGEQDSFNPDKLNSESKMRFELAKEAVPHILQMQLIGLLRVVLFGSVAKGTATENSDTDLALVFEGHDFGGMERQNIVDDVDHYLESQKVPVGSTGINVFPVDHNAVERARTNLHADIKNGVVLWRKG